MRQQSARVGKGLFAIHALVRLVPGVDAPVNHKIAGLRKVLEAKVALVRFLTCVGAFVRRERVAVAKPLLANRTYVGLFSSMDASVFGENVRAVKHLGTKVTCIAFGDRRRGSHRPFAVPKRREQSCGGFMMEMGTQRTTQNEFASPFALLLLN